MKFYTVLTAVTLLSSSCNTSREGCYTGNANSPYLSNFEVAASPSYTIQEKDNSFRHVSPLAFKEAEVITIHDNLAANEQQINQPEQTAPLLIAMAPAENAQAAHSDLLAITTFMANNLRMSASEIESRFAKRMLTKSANRIEKMNFESSGSSRVTVLDKIRMKVSDKFFASAAVPPGQGNVLAIVSLITGILAFAWYASFPLGLTAIITGAIALARGTSRRGMAIAGIILGAIAIALWAGIIGGGVI